MTVTLPAGSDLRDCHLYRFWVRHPVTGQRVLGYIGETVRMPFARLMEHVMDQPWADTILAWEVDDVVYPGKPAVLRAEREAIQSELPLYNHEHNQSNPHRIPIPVAIRQRRARDAGKLAPRWVHPDDRGPIAQSARVVPAARSAHPWIRPACIWSTSWALVAAIAWGYLQDVGLPWTGRTLTASLLSTGLLLWGRLRPLDSWKVWRRRLRKPRRARRRRR